VESSLYFRLRTNSSENVPTSLSVFKDFTVFVHAVALTLLLMIKLPVRTNLLCLLVFWVL